MRSLKIQFTTSGASLVTNTTVEGNNATAQACLVNIGTRRGSDRVFPSRGTNLFRETLTRRWVSSERATHALSFAGIDTVFFVRANEPASTPDKVSKITSATPVIIGNRVVVTLSLKFKSGDIIGVVSPLTSS